MKPANETRTHYDTRSDTRYGSGENGVVADAICHALESRITHALALLVTILCILAFASALLGARAAGAEPTPGTSADSGTEIDGTAAAELFVARKCSLCHGIVAAGIEAKTKSDKLKGPDLSGYTHDDPKSLRAYLQDGAELDGKTHRRKSKIGEAELASLLVWLGSLEPGPAAD